jgi:hypothetical protein
LDELEVVISACFGSGLILWSYSFGCPALEARASGVFLCFRFASSGILQDFQPGLDVLEL